MLTSYLAVAVRLRHKLLVMAVPRVKPEACVFFLLMYFVSKCTGGVCMHVCVCLCIVNDLTYVRNINTN